MPHGGTTKDENYSPPREGRRGGLSRTIGPTPKATPSAPPQRGFSAEILKQALFDISLSAFDSPVFGCRPAFSPTSSSNVL